MKNTYEPMYNNTFEFKVDKELMENKKYYFIFLIFSISINQS